MERFQLSVYLLIIGFRNLAEVSATLDSSYVVYGLLAPLSLVFVSELLVDWLKHSFITKFNHIHPDVYLRFMDTLCRDFANGQEATLADQSPAVSRRIGFSSFPLFCLLLRIVLQTMAVSEMTITRRNLLLISAVLASLFVVKVAVGMLLIRYTHYRTRQLGEPRSTTIPTKTMEKTPTLPETLKARAFSADFPASNKGS